MFWIQLSSLPSFFVSSPNENWAKQTNKCTSIYLCLEQVVLFILFHVSLSEYMEVPPPCTKLSLANSDPSKYNYHFSMNSNYPSPYPPQVWAQLCFFLLPNSSHWSIYCSVTSILFSTLRHFPQGQRSSCSCFLCTENCLAGAEQKLSKHVANVRESSICNCSVTNHFVESFMTNYVLSTDNEWKPEELNQNLNLHPLGAMIGGPSRSHLDFFPEMHSMSPWGKFRSLFTLQIEV